MKEDLGRMTTMTAKAPSGAINICRIIIIR
jgi:hypothetical protein